jgi:hypothetical protein
MSASKRNLPCIFIEKEDRVRNNHYQTPPTWLPAFGNLPILLEVTHWQLLRKWALSEVWRITTRSGKTWIAKWARGSQSIELDMYLNVLIPLQVKTASLHSFICTEDGHFFILEDLGIATIEQQPEKTFFIEAAKTLAHVRRSAARHLASDLESIPQKYVISPQQYLDTLAFLLDHQLLTNSDKGMLTRLLPWFSGQLTALYTHLPLTLSHNDYHMKNLVLSGDTVVPIDWSNASISPHLADLYCLLREAESVPISASSLIEAFQVETQPPYENAPALLQWNAAFEWQIALGGICWLLTSLRWVLDEGIQVIPDASQWIPGLLQDIERCIALRSKYC